MQMKKSSLRGGSREARSGPSRCCGCVQMAAFAIVVGLFVFEFAKKEPDSSYAYDLVSLLDMNKDKDSSHVVDCKDGTQTAHSLPHPLNHEGTYEPSKAERYLLDHSKELGYHGDSRQTMPSGCQIWRNESFPMRAELNSFKEQLLKYNEALDDLLNKKREQNSPSIIKALRKEQKEASSPSSTNGICDSLELHPDGIVPGIFSSDGILSRSSSGGWMEPLLPPMKHPRFCDSWDYAISLSHFIYDFASLCRKLRPTSRIVLFDLGACLDYHGDAKGLNALQKMPALYISSIFQWLGFKFDHIYAFEIEHKNSTKVFKQIPKEMKAAYHNYNVGVSAVQGAQDNPWTMLKENFEDDDFIIVKIDIDAPAVEKSLANQLLADQDLTDLIDVFYFENHVFMEEMAGGWDKNMMGSIDDSMRLFHTLRQKGVAAHFWV